MPFSALSAGQLALTGSAQQLAASAGEEGVGSFMLRAHSANAGKVYVGSSNAVTTSNGFELAAGEAVAMDILQISDVWVIGTAADRVSWLALR